MVKPTDVIIILLYSQGVYVRAVGNVRSFNDAIHIVSHDIRPLEDHNELTHHLLETIYLHCVNTKGPQQVSSTSNDHKAKRLFSLYLPCPKNSPLPQPVRGQERHHPVCTAETWQVQWPTNKTTTRIPSNAR
jgi:hypothetical protein